MNVISIKNIKIVDVYDVFCILTEIESLMTPISYWPMNVICTRICSYIIQLSRKCYYINTSGHSDFYIGCVKHNFVLRFNLCPSDHQWPINTYIRHIKQFCRKILSIGNHSPDEHFEFVCWTHFFVINIILPNTFRENCLKIICYGHIYFFERFVASK